MSKKDEKQKGNSKNTEMNPPNAGKTVHSEKDNSTKKGVQYNSGDKSKKSE